MHDYKWRPTLSSPQSFQTLECFFRQPNSLIVKCFLLSLLKNFISFGTPVISQSLKYAAIIRIGTSFSLMKNTQGSILLCCNMNY